MRKKLIYFVALSAILFSGCEQENEAVPSVSDNDIRLYEQNLSGIQGTRLASLKISEDYFVSFWEVNPGSVIIHEAYPAEAKDFTRLNIAGMLNGNKAFADVYKTLSGDKLNISQWKALQDADKRVIENKYTIEEGDKSPATCNHTPATLAEGRVNACGDVLGDNYGAQWFLNNYFTAAPSRFQTTNAFSAQFDGTIQWLTVSGMEADFNNSASAQFTGTQIITRRVSRRFNPIIITRVPIWNVTVPKRMIYTFTVGSGEYDVDLIGYSPCGARVHFAAMWQY
jgi:hypothetical protein